MALDEKAFLDNLLAVIKADATLSAYILDSGIIPDVNYNIYGWGFPAIGLKDGRAVYERLSVSTGNAANYNYLVHLDVFVYVYVSIQEPANLGAGIVNGTSEKGVLTIIKDLESLLDNNLLSNEIDAAFIVERLPSELMSREPDRAMIHRKGLRMRYAILEVGN